MSIRNETKFEDIITQFRYQNRVIVDFGLLLHNTYANFISYVEYHGISYDLNKKDNQKIIFHFLMKELCEFLKKSEEKPVFYVDTNEVNYFKRNIIKVINKSFGIKIYSDDISFKMFMEKLEMNITSYNEKFELFLNTNDKPKSFKQIKKFLEREGFTDLVENYFQDIENKMVILC